MFLPSYFNLTQLIILLLKLIIRGNLVSSRGFRVHGGLFWWKCLGEVFVLYEVVLVRLCLHHHTTIVDCLRYGSVCATVPSMLIALVIYLWVLVGDHFYFEIGSQML